jgi:CRP-like cAMP-binding protein
MTPEARSVQLHAIAPHPLVELLECPPETGNLLNRSSQCLEVAAGEVVFHQFDVCRGLYLVVTGQFQRKTERVETRLTLSRARPGDLVELAAALGDGRHTYRLVAENPGTLLLISMDALNQAFKAYPSMRMRLLEELAREVSRGYTGCTLARMAKVRRRKAAGEADSGGTA